jgi:dihydrodipicolinate synthase/N-acetylneuraminate lyase
VQVQPFFAIGVLAWDSIRSGAREGLAVHDRLAALWEALSGSTLPARVKACQRLQGVPAGFSRPSKTDVTATELDMLLSRLADL